MGAPAGHASLFRSIALVTPSPHPAIERLHANSGLRPLVASHRGASQEHPENTLTAFRRATQLGVAIQEFDVRELSCGELVCVHDATWDRTTDSCQLLGPGALVAQTDLQTARTLNAAAAATASATHEPVPTLKEALDAMLPTCVPLIEHKAGTARRYVEFLRAEQRTGDVILQSFDWQFLADVRQLAKEIAIAALGPKDGVASPTSGAIKKMQAFGAQLVHWRATDLTRADVKRLHAQGLLVCTYTTDNELGWFGGQALGVDAMCTNDPETMRTALNRTIS